MDIYQSIGLPLVALIGGYFFVVSFNVTKFWCSQYYGHRLYFSAALAGLTSLAIARAILLNDHDDLASHSSDDFWAAMSVISLFVQAGLVGHAIDRHDGIEEMNDRAKTVVILLGLVVATVMAFTISKSLAVTITALHEGNLIVAGILGTGLAMHLTLRRLLLQKWFVTTFRVGLFLLLSGLVVTIYGYNRTGLIQAWSIFSPIKNAEFYALSLFLSIIFPRMLNLLFPKESTKSLMVRRGDDDRLQALIWNATVDEKSVQFDLRNGKVYIGYVLGTPPNLAGPDPYLRILPVVSGYRRPDNHELILMTFYQRIYRDRIVEKLSVENREELGKEFAKIIDYDEIVCASFFDPKVYKEFAAQLASQP